jgi:hypothetical protein
VATAKVIHIGRFIGLLLEEKVKKQKQTVFISLREMSRILRSKMSTLEKMPDGRIAAPPDLRPALDGLMLPRETLPH